jgi:hypothetical protein
MVEMKARQLFAAMGLALAAASSHAVLITSSALPGSVIAEDPQTLPGTASLSGSAYLNATGSVANEKRSPWDIGTNNTDTRPYHYAKNGGSITLTLDDFAEALEFVWGSPDAYNTLTLFTATGSFSVIPGSSPIGVDPLNSYLVKVTAENSGEWFNKVVFSSNSPSFEFANVTVQSVPAPATAALLLPLLGIAGLLRRRAARTGG